MSVAIRVKLKLIKIMHNLLTEISMTEIIELSQIHVEFSYFKLSPLRNELTKYIISKFTFVQSKLKKEIFWYWTSDSAIEISLDTSWVFLNVTSERNSLELVSPIALGWLLNITLFASSNWLWITLIANEDFSLLRMYEFVLIKSLKDWNISPLYNIIRNLIYFESIF